MWPCALSGRLSIEALVGHYPTNKLIDRGPILERIKLSPRRVVCGISPSFPGLFPTQGQVTHVLLTRSPLYSPPEGSFLVRLACVRRAASVDSEPGSNSRGKVFCPRRRKASRTIPQSLPIRHPLGIDENVLHVQPIYQRSVPPRIVSSGTLRHLGSPGRTSLASERTAPTAEQGTKGPGTAALSRVAGRRGECKGWGEFFGNYIRECRELVS